MSSSTVQAVSLRQPLGLADARLYLATAAMVLGNLALPWAVHRIPGAGPMLMPILFFTLVAGWRFGAQAGVLTGVFSPLTNHFLTGMPPTPALTGLIVQSALLAVLAAGMGSRSGKATLARLAVVVLLNQALVGAAVLVQAGAGTALAGFRLHVPGMLLQVLGGWAALRLLALRQD
ncbi:MAG: ECF transporter S component [Holophaga sp.]|jgi:thiamine transporter ThiT